MQSINTKTQYFLAEACGNTFLLVDCLSSSIVSDTLKKRIHTDLLKLNRDDALILVNGQEKSGSLYVKMLVLGADGLLGEFCGNGARACAAYLYQHYPAYKKFFITTEKNVHELMRYSDELYSIKLPTVNFIPNQIFIQSQEIFQNPQAPNQFQYEGKTFYYADALEPHLLLPEPIDPNELFILGRQVNKNTALFPLGINITAFTIERDKVLKAVTYERGVQRLTQSCGTGASCAAAFYLQGSSGEVTVINPGGLLKINQHPHYLELKGPAMLYFAQ